MQSQQSQEEFLNPAGENNHTHFQAKKREKGKGKKKIHQKKDIALPLPSWKPSSTMKNSISMEVFYLQQPQFSPSVKLRAKPFQQPLQL